MKSKTTLLLKKTFKYTVLFMSLTLFTFCESKANDFVFTREQGLTKDSKIVSLMIDAVKDNNTAGFKTKSTDESTQCTNFVYPMTLQVFPGDDLESIQLTINNDEELIDFLTTLITTYEFYVNWPLTLIDVDGVETNLYSLEELEGTLETIVEACSSGDDDNNDDSDDEDNQYDFCSNNNKKVYICHKGKTICVSINAIWGHLAHHSEDYLGQCQ